MKHEALTEAISMLDDRLIAEAQQPFKKRSVLPAVMKLCGAAAVCAAAVGAFLLIPRGSGADILVLGEDPSVNPVSVKSADIGISAVRAFAIEYTDIPVEIVSSEKTVVSVSAGELFITGSGEADIRAELPLELNGGASLMWSVPLLDISAEYTLTAQTGDNCRVLLLSFDEGAQEWVIRDN